MVSDSPSGTIGGDQQPISPINGTYTSIFEKMCPYYMSIGMSYDEFWNHDVTRVKAYREAEKLRIERRNQELWLQGLYVYDAVCAASPIFRTFAKRGTKPLPYIDAPYPITREKNKTEMERHEKKTCDKGKAYMMAVMMQNNKRFAKGEVREDGKH